MESQKSAPGRAPMMGRARETESLLTTLHEDGPRTVFVHGIAGIGKSTLLRCFEVEARGQDATVIRLDCHELEPTEPGFLSELGRAIGVGGTATKVHRRIQELGHRIVIVLDTYEVLRLLDSWLRGAFLPALPANARMILAGREQPSTPWFAQDRFHALALGPLAPADAEDVLMRAGMASGEAKRVNGIVRGYPLGLAIAGTTRDFDVDVAEAAVHRVVEELTRAYLADLEPLTREALDAASVLRRVTLPLIAAMMPDAAPHDAYERLRALPFVETRHDGAMVHETMANAIVTALRSADPERHRRLRRLAWRQLRTEIREAGPHELWRYTADMLYLIENPIVREAFFPAGAHTLVVEPAKPSDADAILAIAARHEPPAAVVLVERWWRAARDAFFVVRDTDGAIVGFTCVLRHEDVTPKMAGEDPVVGRWREHLRSERIPSGQTAIFHRWWLGLDLGEAPSPVQASAWLEIKRLYMELRPRLRRVYGVVRAIDTYFPTFQKLGFEPLPGDPIQIDGVANFCAVLDFGPASVDGWLTRLAAAELGIDEENLLDAEQRELVLENERMPLTRLEFDVMRYLSERADKPVSRLDLIRDVWGYDFDGGSNVVDVVMRSLRKKLGARAGAIEAVRGIGYRFRGDR